MTSKTVSKTVWGIINGLKNRSVPEQIKLKINDQLVSDPSQVAEEFNLFFSSVATSFGLRPPQAQKHSKKHSPAASMLLEPVVEEEIIKVIQKLPSKKSNDHNFFSVWLLKKCFKHLLSPLTQLVNFSFQLGIFLSQLKAAKITPIFKKGDPHSVSNHRPISILPAFSKIFERLFLNRLLMFLEKHNILSNQQFGFRKRKSTIDAVVRLVETILEGLEDRRLTLGVFLDLSKAFDCVDHSILLDKLETYGVRGVSNLWLKSYLSDRYQIVQVSNKSSKTQKIQFGVPQGSILGPILFLIYVNDTGSSLQHGQLVQYADDTTLCVSGKTKADLEFETFIDLNSCIQYFDSINLKTNASKSNFINFGLRPKNNEDGPAVMLVDAILEETYTTKFLGIHLDGGLTWNNHIDNVCSKLCSGIYVLRSLAKYCPTQVLMTAYYGLIYPHLSYGIVLWGGCSSTAFTRVFLLQKKAVRIIAKLNYRESCKPVFKELQLLTLPCLYILETAVYCMSKCDLIRGCDVHSYGTRGRDTYRQRRHRTVAYEHLPSQAGVRIVNKLPDSLKSVTTPKAFKTLLKSFLASKAFYSAGEFFAHEWET